MEEIKNIYRIDKYTFQVDKIISYEEYIKIPDKNLRYAIARIIKKFKKRNDNNKGKIERTRFGYFYCEDIDYNLKEIKKYLNDNRRKNNLPKKSGKKVNIYLGKDKVEEIESINQAALFLGIKKQRLYYNLNRYHFCIAGKYLATIE